MSSPVNSIPISQAEQQARAAADAAVLAINPDALAELDPQTRRDALNVAINALGFAIGVVSRLRDSTDAESHAMKALTVSAQIDARARSGT